MTSSLGRAEAPQAVLLTICSWSPVSHVILVRITKTLYVSLESSLQSLILTCFLAFIIKAEYYILDSFSPGFFL